MRTRTLNRKDGFGMFASVWAVAAAVLFSSAAQAGLNVPLSFSLYQDQGQPAPGQEPKKEAPKAETMDLQAAEEEAATQPAAEKYGYRGTSSFYTIREAYSNVKQGQWEFEFTFFYATRDRTDDSFRLTQSLKYGVTDDFHIELAVAEPLGDGGRGVGELELTLFNTFWHETEWLPAFAGLASMRIPTGYQSSGVDGTFSGILTKTICEPFRFHIQGFVQTANGEPGDFSGDRRHFQWGVGPGFDLKLWEGAVGVLNYLNRSSETYGEHNQNILQLGLTQKLPDITESIDHALKLAFDIGLDGDRETPNFGVRVQWGIGFK
jgi:hypothetical protein